MATAQLQFQGTENQSLLTLLLAGVALVLAAAGAWRLARRRWRSGLMCLAGASGPPVFAVFALLDGVVRRLRCDRRGARASLLAAEITLAGMALAVGWIVLAGRSGPSIWMVVLALEVAIAIGVFYSAVYSSLGTPRMAALMALRCAAILALLTVLFKPAVRWTADDDEAKPYLPILVDRSGSMGTAEQGGATRYQQVVQMLTFQRQRLGEHFRSVWYDFAQSSQRDGSLEALAELRPAGTGTDGTNIAGAIRRAVADRVRGDLPGVLVLTDGVHNAADRLRDAVAEAGVPIYVAGVGATQESASGRPNVQILSAEAPMEVIQNNVATITVGVNVSRMGYAVPRVQAADEGGAEVASAPLERTDKAVDVQSVRLKWTPPAPAGEDAEGGAAYVRRLRISVPPAPNESITDDNATEFHALVTQPRIRVLYVEGSMRPEYKYLRRLLSTDPNVQCMGLVRVQDNKFWAQGSVAGKQLAALPANDEDFAMFDVIILGDLDRTFLSLDQMARIRKFVNDGGALLMLGGHNSFGPGGYGETDVETVLPVVVGPRAQEQETTPLVPQLTAEGEAHPIFEGIAGYFFGPGGRKPSGDLAPLPEMLGCVTVLRAKPAAAVLAVHPTRKNDAGLLPILATMQYGAGRSAAFTADTTWKWYLPLAGLGAESPYQRFWGQLIRWLANVETKRRKAASAVVLRLDRSYLQVGQTAKVVALVHDQAGQATASAQVACKVVSAGDEKYEESLPLAPAGESGLYEATYRAAREGAYKLVVSAVGGDGQALGEDQLSLRVAPHSAELDHLARDESTLREIADGSSGRYEDVARLPELIDAIIDRQKGLAGPAVQAEIFRLYNMPVLFLLFVGLLTAEWVLRRRWQLH